jgi:CRISPR-associated protein Cmr5
MNQPTPVQLMEQKRAQFALKRVKAACADASVIDSEFKAYIRRLPAMIQTNGLGQSLAFYNARMREKAAYLHIVNLVNDWLCQPGMPYENSRDALDGITTEDMFLYRQADAELRALLSWLKKFAEAYCGNGTEGANK